MHFFWFYSYLIALATRTAGLTSLEPIDVMPGEEGVGRTLLALVSVFVDEVSSRTGDTRRAVLLTHHCTGVATRRWAIHRVSHRDWVDLRDVIYIVTHLGETDSEWERLPCNKGTLDSFPVYTYINGFVGTLESPCVRHRSIFGHDVGVCLSEFTPYPWFHNICALPVYILQRRHWLTSFIIMIGPLAELNMEHCEVAYYIFNLSLHTA